MTSNHRDVMARHAQWRAHRNLPPHPLQKRHKLMVDREGRPIDNGYVLRLRGTYGISRRILALAMGVSRRTVEGWEYNQWRCPYRDHEIELRIKIYLRKEQ